MRVNIVTGFFLPVPPLAGGSTEKAWHGLACELANRGHAVTVISRTWAGLPDSEGSGNLRHLRLRGSDHSASLPRNLWLDLRWGLQVRARLPAADVTICNTVSLPVLLGVGRHTGGKVAAVMARMPKGHGKFYGKSDRIYALSNEVIQRLVAENRRLAPRVRLLPYPIDWNRLDEARATQRRPTDTPLEIFFIGRIHPEKGVELLIEAAAHLSRNKKLPSWRVLIIGPHAVRQGGGGEPYVTSLQRRFYRELGGQLEIRGPEFDPGRLASCYAKCDVFCYPSLAEGGETFGVAVAEAMAAGATPVVSNLACFRDLVRDGETGLIFDHLTTDPAGNLAHALEKLLMNPALRKDLSNRARAHAKGFDFNTLGSYLEADLRELTGAA
jgi:glycosyltransferase involved in cell wall biosynthesis